MIIMKNISNECKVLIERLKEADLDDLLRNPSLMLKYYPISNPDNEATIFDEIYALMNERVMLKSYKFRLFFYLNTCLSSIKVPAYVIAAYIKKLSRLSLNAKPRSLVIILRIVGNLLLRHPTLIVLRDRVDEKARELEQESDTVTLRYWLEDDPFDAEQTTDLKLTKAMDSCIWELMPLRFHRHVQVAESARYLGQNTLPEIEFDLEYLIK